MQHDVTNEICDIASNFEKCIEVSTENVCNANEYRVAQYKNRFKTFANQEARRKEFLELRKNKRNDLHMKLRQIADDSSSDDEYPMETDSAFSRSKRPRKYKNTLMLSEWMIQQPSDFPDNWLLSICPVGKRCLLVSSKGGTKAFARNGYLMKCFASELPAGNKNSERKYKQKSILDCIFCENEETFYVLDILFWNGVSFYDSEAEFRFYWLSSKLNEECPTINTKSASNRYKFIDMPRFKCDHESVSHAIGAVREVFTNEIDGLLFFHKHGEYTVGTSPLVCWLKQEMLTEVLHATLNDAKI